MDRNRLEGSVNLIGRGDRIFGVEEGTRLLAGRSPRPDLSADPDLPDDTRLWAALQQAGGGTWGESHRRGAQAPLVAGNP